MRLFSSYLDDVAGRVDVEVFDLARRIGIGERFGPNAPFHRTVRRCVDFQMAEWRAEVLAVRRRLPPLARRHLRRLPAPLQKEHERYLRTLPAGLAQPASHVRGRALALVESGADHSGTEQALVRSGIPRRVAEAASGFASLEHARRRAAREASST